MIVSEMVSRAVEDGFGCEEYGKGKWGVVIVR